MDGLNEPRWTDPGTGALLARLRDRASGVSIATLWERAARVEGVVHDRAWQESLSHHAHTLSGTRGLLLCPAPSAPADAPSWSPLPADHDQGPQFLLFYPAGSAFPDSAVVFSGGPEASTIWATFHYRPLVLYHLRRRFQHLLALSSAAAPETVTAVREEAEGSNARDPSDSFPFGPEDARPEPARVSADVLYAHVLRAQFAELVPGAGADTRPTSAPALAVHQERAYERARAILDRYGGVILADAVGLGKTYVGSRLVEDALRGGGSAVIVAPAALRSHWERHLGYLGTDREGRSTTPKVSRETRDTEENLDLRLGDRYLETRGDASRDNPIRDGEVDPRVEGRDPRIDIGDEGFDPLSTDSLDSAIEYRDTGSRRGDGLRASRTGGLGPGPRLREGRPARVDVVSIEAMGRRGFRSEPFRDVELIVVDEAHHFRNPATRRYRALARLARGREIALLTATPINNSIRDLASLVELFAAPGAFRHLGITDFRREFQLAAHGRGDVQPIVSACVIRRTPRFLRDHYGDVGPEGRGIGLDPALRFPLRSAPRAIAYDLAGTYGTIFDRLESWLHDLRFPGLDLQPDGAPGMPPSNAELLKIIILKRLESSVEAVRRTVAQQVAWCLNAREAAETGRLLTRREYRAGFQGSTDDPGSQLALFELMLPESSLSPRLLQRYRAQLQSDLEVLTQLRKDLRAIAPRDDRKLGRLIDLLEGQLHGAKILIFTEFRDTARYLHRQLRGWPHLAQIDSQRARLGVDRASREDVILRFAPRSNGMPEPPNRERVDLLIATDVIGEGLNLQDASTVISYDLPWNPVRLMQRFGRIDRLGAIPEIVRLFHFLPGDDLERLLRLLERLESKLSAIETTLGPDAPVLAPLSRAEQLDHLRDLAKNATGFSRLEGALEDPLAPEEQAYIDYCKLAAAGMPRESGPVCAAALVDGPAAPTAVALWQLLSAGPPRSLWLVCDLSSGRVFEDQARALYLLRSARTGAEAVPSENLLGTARRLLATEARSVYTGLLARRVAGERLSPSLPQCRIAAWLSRGYEESALSLPAERRVEIDRLLDRLGARFTRAVEGELARIADDLPPGLDRGTIGSLEELLAGLAPPDRAPLRLTEIATLILMPETT